MSEGFEWEECISKLQWPSNVNHSEGTGPPKEALGVFYIAAHLAAPLTARIPFMNEMELGKAARNLHHDDLLL